jgi:hypothetical protein
MSTMLLPHSSWSYVSRTLTVEITCWLLMMTVCLLITIKSPNQPIASKPCADCVLTLCVCSWCPLAGVT